MLLHRFLRSGVPLKLVCRRPKAYAEAPKTLGEHLLKRRSELGATQFEVATRLGTSLETVGNWEKDQAEPAMRFFPAIFAFLGYDPFPLPRTLAERLLSKRRALGLSVKRAAEMVGVDEATFSAVEKEAGISAKSLVKARKFLAL